ncbi:MAG: bacteriocin fulvocin C-related protein [Flavobacteriaceae bacterium]|nr:bacteriocin fulvocin C-related protein [Flavobacteriaceae bacterium]
MKNYYVLFVFMISIVFQSCETSEFDSLETSSIDIVKIQSVIDLSGDEQRVAFRLLNNESKAFLWKKKINNVLKSQNLTAIQKKLVVELQTYIKASLYNTGSKEYFELDEKVKNWASKIEEHFVKEQIVNYFTTLSELNVTNGGPVFEGDNNCACNTSEDYCLWSTCDSGLECETSYTGCGILWASPCNGLCD